MHGAPWGQRLRMCISAYVDIYVEIIDPKEPRVHLIPAAGGGRRIPRQLEQPKTNTPLKNPT